MKYLQLWMLRQNWSLTSAGSDGKLFQQEYWGEIGEPVVCSTQCLCEHESEKGEATYNAKYKVTVVWQQAVTAQCLFCEFTAPIPSPATFEIWDSFVKMLWAKRRFFPQKRGGRWWPQSVTWLRRALHEPSKWHPFQFSYKPNSQFLG